MGTGTTTDYIVATDDAVDPISGSLFYRTTGRVTYGTRHDTGLSQLVPIRGEAGDVFTISGWMNLWGVPDNAYAYAIHQIECRIRYSNGKSVDIAAAKANPYFIGWQYVSQSFVLKNDQPAGVTITGARKRFGSCSAKNRLCFSWRLMGYPEEAIDYVVVHELAHIRHPDHSPAFHMRVRSFLPEADAVRIQMKALGDLTEIL